MPEIVSKLDKTKLHLNLICSFDGDVDLFVETRKAHGYSQENLADAMGLADVSVIGHFESGRFVLDERTYTIFLLITDTHPDYSLKRKENKLTWGGLIIDPPKKSEKIRRYRKSVEGLTQDAMSELMGLKSGKSIISNYEHGKKSPSKQNWTLFLLMTDQHPSYYLIDKYAKEFTTNDDMDNEVTDDSLDDQKSAELY